MKLMRRLLLVSLVLAVFFTVPASASAAFSLDICIGTLCDGIGGVAYTILGLINNVLVPLLFAIAFIVFLWGVFKSYIWNGGEERAGGHQLILWGIIGFVVMISIWGLVNVVATSFGLGGDFAPQTPRFD